ncbi:hypothetical protein CL629_00240 [bacterium]|nr:hypothetical protein [bacterium]|tara:strand:- start:3670 stop:4512 length:843 start_codon:yes stop_codon:yes gene_type:complete
MKPKVILYHSNCEDGFSAAWAAWKKFKNKASYIPVDYQKPPPKGLKNKDIFLLDFSYPEDIIKRLIKNNKSITILDHHITAQKGLSSLSKSNFDNFNAIFKNSHSGAVIAWNFFHAKKKAPKLLEYVEDIDLWKFKKKNSKEISAVLQLISYTFKEWSKFALKAEDAKTRKEIIKQGKTILSYQNKIIKRIARQAKTVTIKGKKALAVNCPVLASEIGNELSKGDIPIGIVWFEDKKKIKISLRSNGKVDISKIAEQFGGGGHKAAASFRLPKNAKLPWK